MRSPPVFSPTKNPTSLTNSQEIGFALNSPSTGSRYSFLRRLSLTRTLDVCRKPRSQVQTTQLALLLLRYTAGRRNGCALKIANVSPKYITTCLPKVSGHSRSLLLTERGTLRDTGEELQHGASANPEGNRGAGVRTPRKPSWEESLRARRSAEKRSWLGGRNRLDSPKPARPPRPSRPRSSASRRRKCCVAHFRVLSGRRHRASVDSGPPPPPPPWVLEPGATSPPWPASKL
ncbi:leptin receptor overlapping transcript-like 1 isoform 1-T1 [Hipposideros larvatus]